MIFQTVNCVTKKKAHINLEAQFKANKTLSALYIHLKKKIWFTSVVPGEANQITEF